MITLLLTAVLISFVLLTVEGKNKDKFFLSKCHCKAAFIRPECDFSKLSKAKLRDLVDKLQTFQLTCVSADGINLPSFTMAMNPTPFSTLQQPPVSASDKAASKKNTKNSETSNENHNKGKFDKKKDDQGKKRKEEEARKAPAAKRRASTGFTGELDEDDEEEEDDEFTTAGSSGDEDDEESEEKEIKPRDVQALLQEPGAEQQHCLGVQEALYHYNLSTVRDTVDQWDRLLPVIIKTQLARHEPMPARPKYRAQEQEFPLNHERFHFLGPIFHQVCKGAIEKYGEGDEEKRACGLQTLQYLHQIKDECVVYSIGSGNQWLFEEDVVRHTDCKIHTFDCVIPADTKPPAHLQDRVFFHPVCLSDRKYVSDKGEVYVTWADLHELTATKVAPTFLKMDIEGYEFPVLRSIIESGTQLPLQIAAEMHLVRWESGAPVWDRIVPTSELLSFGHYLRKFGGYYIIDRRDNKFCATCAEVILAKLDCSNHPNTDEDYQLLQDSKHRKFKAMVANTLDSVYYT